MNTERANDKEYPEEQGPSPGLNIGETELVPPSDSNNYENN